MDLPTPRVPTRISLRRPMFARVFLPLLTALLLAAPACAQLVGVVTDAASGAPVFGATVTLKPRGAGGVTDAAGRYRLRRDATAGDTLEVSRLGYRTSRIGVIGAVDGIDVALVADTVMLQAIAAIGTASATDSRNVCWMQIAPATAPGVRGTRARAGWSALTALEEAVSLRRAACIPAPEPGVHRECVWIRGAPTPLRVYVDDALTPRGTEDMAALPLHEVYRITFDPATAVVRVETSAHVEARALAYLATQRPADGGGARVVGAP